MKVDLQDDNNIKLLKKIGVDSKEFKAEKYIHENENE